MSIELRLDDVFLSYSLADAALAQLVSDSLQAAGLSVFDPMSAGPGEEFSEEIRRALATSEAIVLIASPDREPGDSSLVELGAAMAWHKPVFVVRPNLSTARLPEYLQRYKVYTASRLDDVARDIRRAMEVFSDEKRALLEDVYLDEGVSTDQLLSEPSSVDRLANAFRARSGMQVSGERLVQELIRLRKSGRLPHMKKPPHHS